MRRTWAAIADSGDGGWGPQTKECLQFLKAENNRKLTASKKGGP